MKTSVVSVLGMIKDAAGGKTDARWHCWRPNIGLAQQECLPIDEFHLIIVHSDIELAEFVKQDIVAVSPRTNVILHEVAIKNAWDFEEVYGAFYDLAQKSCFHEDETDYYIHISTGSHVEQICLFLLAESHNLPGKLVQTSPKEGHAVRDAKDPKGKIDVIDLDLSRYDKIARRFERKRQNDLAFLKQGIATRNKSFNKLIETIEQVAVRSTRPLLLCGPTGAGKTQLASLIYELRRRNCGLNGKYVKVNCAALSGELVQSALFGYRKGAFTGAIADTDGYIKEADGGVLFLDEIGTLPGDTQALLLKAIEEKAFRPLGAKTDEHSDFQLICGTNADLESAVETGKFRRDLLERINLWNFRLPGLADRREDIEPNIEYEIERYSRETKKHISFSMEARKRFVDFALDSTMPWTGNFRELNAMITRMATLAEGGRISTAVVEEEIRRSRASVKKRHPQEAAPEDEIDIMTLLGEDYASRFDTFDLVQLSYVVRICRESRTMADAAKKLFSVSRLSKKSANDTDRLSKYLARFGLKFKEL